MGKSFDPMLKEKAGSGSRAHSRRSSASMSLQSAIPRRVALQQRTPLLHRLQSACDRLTLPVNRYGNDGNIAEPVNFNRPPEPPGGQTENRDFHLGIAENCPNNRDHRNWYFLRNALGIFSQPGPYIATHFVSYILADASRYGALDQVGSDRRRERPSPFVDHNSLGR